MIHWSFSDGNGNVSMNGKGVLITINDKQSYLSGDDLVNYLKSIPAEQDLGVRTKVRYPARTQDTQRKMGMGLQERRNSQIEMGRQRL